jgi:hypothetical protein
MRTESFCIGRRSARSSGKGKGILSIARILGVWASDRITKPYNTKTLKTQKPENPKTQNPKTLKPYHPNEQIVSLEMDGEHFLAFFFSPKQLAREADIDRSTLANTRESSERGSKSSRRGFESPKQTGIRITQTDGDPNHTTGI